MTYKEKFVVELKCDGKFLRIKEDTARLPFGTEYSIYLKNLNSRTAVVKISIDGKDVLGGNALVINANTSAELEGFLNNNIVKNRFKFINKTKEIQDYRGDRIDDGIIRVEVAYEKQKESQVILHDTHHHYHYTPTYYPPTIYTSWDTNVYSSNDSISQNASVRSVSQNLPITDPLGDEGITVKGSECRQHFNYTTIGDTDPPTVIVIYLKGIVSTFINSSPEPVTVKTKLVCSSCGKKSKSSFKFCPNCGTFLE